MEAVKFLEELERLMSSKKANPNEVHPNYVRDLYNAVKYIELWSSGHPVKTRLQDFLEKFPNAPVDKDGVPYMRPVTLGYCDVKECEWCKQYYSSSYICWNLPLEK